MGEAKRKRLLAFQRGVEKVRQEGQGVWDLSLFDTESIPAIFSTLPRKMADNLAQCVVQMAETVLRAPIGTGPLCLTCEYEFNRSSDPPRGIGLITGYSPVATRAIINLLCEDCYTHADMKQRVFKVIREKLVTDAREIKINEHTGRA